MARLALLVDRGQHVPASLGRCTTQPQIVDDVVAADQSGAVQSANRATPGSPVASACRVAALSTGVFSDPGREQVGVVGDLAHLGCR